MNVYSIIHVINCFPQLRPLVVQRSGYMITVCEFKNDVYTFDQSSAWCDVGMNTQASPQVLFHHIHFKTANQSSGLQNNVIGGNPIMY